MRHPLGAMSLSHEPMINIYKLPTMRSTIILCTIVLFISGCKKSSMQGHNSHAGSDTTSIPALQPDSLVETLRFVFGDHQRIDSIHLTRLSKYDLADDFHRISLSSGDKEIYSFEDQDGWTSFNQVRDTLTLSVLLRHTKIQSNHIAIISPQPAKHLIFLFDWTDVDQMNTVTILLLARDTCRKVFHGQFNNLLKPLLNNDSLFQAECLTLIENPDTYKPGKRMPFFARVTHKERSLDLTDFYVDTGSGPIYFVTVSNLYSEHYYNHEYRNGSLFVIRRFGFHRDRSKPDSNWTDELWKYDKNGTSKMLFRAGGLDFRFNILGTMAVIEARSSIWFIDAHGTILKEIPFSDIEEQTGMVDLFAWSEDSRIFFIATETNSNYWIRISDWQVGRCRKNYYSPFGSVD
jgi:hypothetical protein